VHGTADLNANVRCNRRSSQFLDKSTDIKALRNTFKISFECLYLELSRLIPLYEVMWLFLFRQEKQHSVSISVDTYTVSVDTYTISVDAYLFFKQIISFGLMGCGIKPKTCSNSQFRP